MITYTYDPEDTILIRIELKAQERRIYLDGHLWPGAELTWLGHPVGHFEGDMLVVTTTQMQPRYIRRNGVPHSEAAVMTEYFMRSGGCLPLVTVLVYPDLPTEPIIRSVT